MERFTETCLTELASRCDYPSVSLCMPTKSWQTFQAVAEDKTRFRNLVAAAESLVAARGIRPASAREMMTPLRDQNESELVWREAQRGLAVFLSPSYRRIFSLPEPPPERVIVGDRFYLKPLLSYLGRRGQFYILAVSENSAKLLAGDRYQLAELEVAGLPHSLEEALNVDTAREAVSVMTTGGRGLGQRAAVYHGQGGARANRKTDLEAYFRIVDQSLAHVLSGASVPLIFAGVSYLFPLYRSINKYPYLLGECIAGNTDLYSNEELRQRAWSLAEPFYARSRAMAAARFTRFHGTGRASNNLQELVWAARDGLVESLFVAIDSEQWGLINAERRTVEPAEGNQPRAEELLDYIAVQTFRNRGLVYVVPGAQVPGGEAAAAVYRYAPMTL
jgi:Bacterial archaeo-eukaryotic release factor family 3